MLGFVGTCELVIVSVSVRYFSWQMSITNLKPLKILNIMVSWRIEFLAFKGSHSMYVFQHGGDATGIIVISVGGVPRCPALDHL